MFPVARAAALPTLCCQLVECAPIEIPPRGVRPATAFAAVFAKFVAVSASQLKRFLRMQFARQSK
jgi:hypothetical protein